MPSASFAGAPESAELVLSQMAYGASATEHMCQFGGGCVGKHRLNDQLRCSSFGLPNKQLHSDSLNVH